MKQNAQTRKTARQLRNERNGSVGSKSRYAVKVKSGDQMYGPGCCGHRIRLPYWGG